MAKLLRLLFSCAFISAGAHANNDFNYESGNKLSAFVRAEYGYIDNFLLSKDNEQSTTYIKFLPSMDMQMQFERFLFHISADTQHLQFQDFSNDNHTDYNVTPSFHYKIAANKTFYLKAKVNKAYQYRGTNLSLGNANALKKGDEYKTSGFYGGYLYGNESSVAKLALVLGKEKYRYMTRRDETYDLDYDKTIVNPRFDYLLSDKTYFLLDLSYSDEDYDDNLELNAEEYSALLGMKWESSNLTKLDVLLGYQTLKFGHDEFDNHDAFKWRIKLDWTPLDGTKVSFNSSRDFESANRVNDSYQLSDNYHLLMEKNITDYLTFSADIGYRKNKIYSDTRDDTENNLNTTMKLTYLRNQWLNMFLEYKYHDLDSTNHADDYQQNITSIGFEIKL